MTKINGHQLIEQDSVGEVGFVNTKLMCSAFNRFLTGRGLATGDWHETQFRHSTKKKTIDRKERTK